MTVPELIGLVAELDAESITRTAIEALAASSAALADAIEILSET